MHARDTQKLYNAYNTVLIKEGFKDVAVAAGIIGTALLGAAASYYVIDKYGEPRIADVYNNTSNFEKNPEFAKEELLKFLNFYNKDRYTEQQLESLCNRIIKSSQNIKTSKQAHHLLELIKDALQYKGDTAEGTTKRILYILQLIDEGKF